MPVEIFSKEEFEQALPTRNGSGEPLWEYLEYSKGEHVYIITVTDTNKRLIIRSSVQGNDKSRASGQDSIRAWVEYSHKNTWRPLGKGKKRWVTRLPGWQGRLVALCRELWQMAVEDSRNYNGNNTVGEPVKEHQKHSTVAITECLQDLDNDQEDSPQPEVIPNAKQLEAITAPVNKAVRVLAPPGAGKTFVIEHRYNHLTRHGINPKNILVVTYSKQMADSMLDRIIASNPDLEHNQVAANQISTIHAFCLRQLRAAGDKREVPKEWQIKKAIQETVDRVWIDNPPTWKEVYAYINEAKKRGLDSDHDLELYSKIRDINGLHVGEKLHAVRKAFDESMAAQGFITFSDMIFEIEQKLLNDKRYRMAVQSRFSHVIVDEGQDTTAQAMKILTCIAEPQNCFFIVGDPDQLLYRFAGSTPEVNLFDGFEERYPNGTLVMLDVNYRSTRAIIETSRRLIENNYSAQGGPYDVKYLKDVSARPDAPDGNPVSWRLYDTVEDEADALRDSLIEAMENGRVPGDFFVGARTRAQLGFLEGPLVRAKIPFINITGGSFWASKHVGDVIAYLRLAYNEGDNEAFQQIYNVGSNNNVHRWGKKKGQYCSHRYLGPAFLQAARGSYFGIQQAAKQRKSWRDGSKDLVTLLQKIQKVLADADSPAEVVQFILDNCYNKYLAEDGLTNTDAAENGKMADLETVIEVAGQFTGENSCQEFLEYVDEAVKAAEAARDKDWKDYVILSTVHRLKGLERPVVYGVGLSEGFSGNGSPSGILPHTFSMTHPPQMGVLPTGGMGRIEDERCICFVLVSRAEEEVHLSGISTYRKASLGPSRFIEEMNL